MDRVQVAPRPGRILLLDHLRGLLMLAVLWHHASAPFASYVLQFHMPALFVLSGYTEFLLGKQVTPRAYVRGKFRRLIVPYFAFEAINYVLFLLVQLPSGKVDPEAGRALYSILVCTNDAHLGLYGRLWFLPAMFVASLIAFCVRQAFASRALRTVSCLALFLLSYLSTLLGQRLPFCLDTALLGAAFLLVGHLAGGVLQKLLARPRGLLACGAALSAAVLYVAANRLFSPGCYMYENRYSDYPAMVLCALCGTLLCFLLCAAAEPLICRVRPLEDLLRFYSVHSLAIFPVHLSVKVLVSPLLERAGVLHWSLVFCAMLFISIPAVQLLSRYAPALLGEKGKQKQKGTAAS